MRGIFSVIVFILMALPLAWFYVAMYWGFTVSRDIAAIERGEDVDMPVFPPLEWLANRGDLRSTFSPNELTDGRTVSAQIAIPFADMLEEGEAMPDRAFKELYATLRAAGYFMPLCDEMLGTLALACDIGSFQADVRHAGDRTSRLYPVEYPETGLAILKASIRYVPAYAMGNPSIVQNGSTESARLRLMGGASVEDTAEAREEIYAEAMALCGGLRVTFGNCVIRSIALEPERNRRGDPEDQRLIRATASFKLVVDKTKFRRDAVQAALDEVAATRLAAIERVREILP